VRRGDILGLVGNSGNSIAPHLHVHVTDGPSPVGSNGLPYEIDGYSLTGRTAGTEAFDRAEAESVALPATPFSPPRQVRNGLPLDQLVVDFS
jgi:murein DD-endopeptidase MepM/ murein hydrolase activator NlpD